VNSLSKKREGVVDLLDTIGEHIPVP
jgi:hypothetical protein